MRWITIMAVGMALAVSTAAASAQDTTSGPAAPGAATPSPPPAKAKPARRHRKAGVTAKAAPPTSTSSSAYQLVPSGGAGSAQTRARQNSFGTPDGDEGGSGRPPVGFGIGGAGGGFRPGMTLGF